MFTFPAERFPGVPWDKVDLLFPYNANDVFVDFVDVEKPSFSFIKIRCSEQRGKKIVITPNFLLLLEERLFFAHGLRPTGFSELGHFLKNEMPVGWKMRLIGFFYTLFHYNMEDEVMVFGMQQGELVAFPPLYPNAYFLALPANLQRVC